MLVTGRIREEIDQVFGEIQIFDRIVAENGALLLNPQTGEERLLSEAMPQRFIAELRRRGGAPLVVGRGICSTWYPCHATVVEAIHDLGLDLRIIFNKGSVMILPAEVTKASGTRVALAELGEPAEAMIAVGDAENDLVFLGMAGCGVAVANALESVKSRADLVMNRPTGSGFEELVDELLRDEMRSRLQRASQQAG